MQGVFIAICYMKLHLVAYGNGPCLMRSHCVTCYPHVYGFIPDGLSSSLQQADELALPLYLPSYRHTLPS